MKWQHFFLASDEPGAPAPALPVRALNFAIAFLIISAIFFFSFHQLTYQFRWNSIYQYRQMFLQGWSITLVLSIAALFLSTLIGLFFALAQRSRLLPLRYISKIYVEVVRGTPLLVQILVFFYVVANAFGIQDRYVVGVLTLAFFSGAYISEIIRAGIESVGKSQMESAQAIGLTRAQTYRYVIFPQTFRQILPPLAGQFASLIKDSSLLSIISINELTWNAQAINARTFNTLESYLPLAAGYLIITLPISLWTRRLERRLRFET